MNAIELFVGAGGLALGVSGAGFEPKIVVEWNKHACATIRLNQRLGMEPVARWPIPREEDVRKVDYAEFLTGGEIRLVSGGPPCQPFSLGGKHRGYDDQRDMFPEAVRAVRETRPQSFIFENVKGLTRQTFSDYLEYIWLQLSYPSREKLRAEDWSEHFKRLRLDHALDAPGEYRVAKRLLNAANYGVPQVRERLFLVGFRAGLGEGWAFPEETHSREALLWDQWVSGEYWDRHEVPVGRRPTLAERDRRKVEELAFLGTRPEKRAWVTVRDALVGLPEPTDAGAARFLNHEFRAGARSYSGHTGSGLDEPAKTLKAGAHGVPGGENMIAYPDGRLRYFTVRESARLQTFPDDYRFEGSWGEAMRQLGNAVPVLLGHRVAQSVAAFLPE